MQSIDILSPERERVWLPVSYAGKEVRFAYPPVIGTHQKIFQEIKNDLELRPAEKLELALLTYATYHSSYHEWQSIRQKYLGVPSRNLWIPKNYVKVGGKIEKGLAGVLVERDIKGIGLSQPMCVPDLKNWKQNDYGIYVSPDSNSQFVPRRAYSSNVERSGFARDGFAIATLTPEGAEIFAKTARDIGKTPDTWIFVVSRITEPEQTVSVLYECAGKLTLSGCDRGENKCTHGFGVVWR